MIDWREAMGIPKPDEPEKPEPETPTIVCPGCRTVGTPGDFNAKYDGVSFSGKIKNKFHHSPGCDVKWTLKFNKVAEK